MRRAYLLLPVFVVCVLSVRAGYAAQPIEWKNPLALPDVAESLADVLNKSSAYRHVIVQFPDLPDRAKRAALENSGIRLLTYLGSNAYFASLSANTDLDSISRIASLTAAPIPADAKLHPILARLDELSYARVPATELTPQLGANPAWTDDTVLLACYVLFHSDVDVDVVPPQIEALGGRVQSILSTMPMVVAWLPEDRVADLAAVDEVQWVEPALPPLSPNNDSNRVATQVDNVQAAPYNLTGHGVTVLVFDDGNVDANHGDFGGRVTRIDSAGISDHPTHVAGTIGGNGTRSGGTYRGMATDATLLSYSVDFGGSYIFISDLGNIETALTTSIVSYGAELSNASLGSNVGYNGYPCSYEGDYTAASILLDGIVRGSTGAPHISIWANGNERGNGCGSLYSTTAPPAPSKNLINVGALNSNDNTMTNFSSWGPTDDGRLKPDVAAPGCQSGGDGGVMSTVPGGGYDTMCGTSMASPTVTGIVALLLEDWKRLHPGESLPNPATVKALLAHTALDLGNPGPDYQYGYGEVQSQALIDQLRTGSIAGDTLDNGDFVEYYIYVSDTTPALKATLAWNDPPAAGNTIPALVNDLDLVAIAPDRTVHYPWTLDPSNPSAPAVRTQRDSRNNHEQVLIDSPATGTWTIRTTGFAVASGPQDFAITTTPALTICSSAGVVRMDESDVACTGFVSLQVVDCDLDTTGTPDVTEVTVSSTSEPAAEVVTLTETGPQTAEFRAQLPIATSNAAGVLLVAHGDTITAQYQDADDGSGGAQTVQATAAVDCEPPQLASAPTAVATKTRATIDATTSEPAQAVLRLSSVCGGPYTDYTESLALRTSHTFEIQGLTANTAYYYIFALTDAAGNVIIDDNAGACYSFSTLANLHPNFFDDFESGSLGDWVINAGGSGDTPLVRLDSSLEEGLVPISGSSVVFLGDSSEGDIADATLDLVLDLRGTEGTVLSFYWVTNDLESDQYIQLDIYDGSWHTNVDSLRYNGITWEQHEIPLGRFNAIDGFIVRFHSHCDYTEDSDASYVDDVAVRATTLKVTPDAVIQSEIRYGAPPVPATASYTLTNSGSLVLSWEAQSDAAWVQASGPMSGILAPAASTELLFNLVADPNALEPGVNPGTITFRDTDNGMPIQRVIELTVLDVLSLAPDSPFCAEGPPGGPFSVSSIDYVVTGSNFNGAAPQRWSASTATPWLTVTPSSGQVSSASPDATINVALNTSAAALPEGRHGGTISFKNDDTGYSFAVRAADLEVSTPPAGAFEWFSMNADPGGTAEGKWEFGVPKGLAGDPSSGHTGSYVVGYNLNGPYSTNIGEECYVLGPFDCSRYTNVTLDFWRWLRVSEACYYSYYYTSSYYSWSLLGLLKGKPETGEKYYNYYCNLDYAAIEISTDGVSWNSIWRNSSEIRDTSWKHETYDISARADEQKTVYIRFVMGPANTGYPEGGWNIDDLALTGNRIDPLWLEDDGPFVTDTCLGDTAIPACVLLAANNADATPIDVNVTATEPWLSVATPTLTLPPLVQTPIEICFNADQLPAAPGVYHGLVHVTNVGTNFDIPVTFSYRLNATPSQVYPVEPGDGATGVSIFTPLQWIGGESPIDSTTYTVLFGTSPDNLTEVCTGADIYDCPLAYFLKSETVHYWTVIPENSCGATPSPVWSFTTQACTPVAPLALSPPDGATGEQIQTTLSWEGVDPLFPDVRSSSSPIVAKASPDREYPLRATGNVVDDRNAETASANAALANLHPNFFDDFESGSLNHWVINAGGGGDTPEVRLDSSMAKDLMPISGDTVVYLGDSTQQGYCDATLDLVLDLSNVPDATLSFYWVTAMLGSDEYIQLDIFDGTWHNNWNNLRYRKETWVNHSIPLNSFNAIDGFIVRFHSHVNYPEGADACYVDDVAVRSAHLFGCVLNYDVTLGTSPTDQSLIYQDLYNNFCPVELDANTTYYWTVTAKNCCGASPPLVSSFTTGDCRLPASAVNPSPANGAVGTPTVQYFTWSGVEYSGCSTSYDLYLGTAPTAMSKVATGLSTGSYIYVDERLLPGTEYFWKVTSRNFAGAVDSSIWSFTTAHDDVQACANENPGFEDGLTGWVAEYTGSDPQYAWQQGSAGTGWFLNGAAYSGSAYAQNLFDGEAGTTYSLSQEISIPFDAESLIVRWADRIQWDLQTYCDTCLKPRTYTVEVQPAGGGNPFVELHSLSLAPHSRGDTGYQIHSVDVLPLVPGLRGADVRLVWREDIPEDFTGPAQLDLDAICVSFQLPPAEGEGEGEGPPPIAGATSLVYMQTCGGGANLVEEALVDLGILLDATITSSTAEFLQMLQLTAPDIVIIDDYANALTAEILDAVSAYHSAGGRVILASIRLNDELAGHPLLATAGIGIGTSFAVPNSVYAWSPTPLWQSRHSVLDLMMSEDLCPEDGFNLLLQGATALAGYVPRFAAAQSALTLSPDGRIIVHGFMPQSFSTQDANANGMRDMAELYANEIFYLLTPGPAPSTYECSTSTLLSQPPMGTESMDTMLPSTDAGSATYENFAGIDRPIGSITWWGAFADSLILDDAISCASAMPPFEVNFYNDDSGNIGPLTATRVVQPKMTYTGRFGLARFPGQRFKAVFTQPVSLDAGWVSIRQISAGGATGCYFAFFTSDHGDGLSRTGFGATGVQVGDPAICIGPREVHHVDTNGDLSIDLVELLRVVQFFNVLSFGCSVGPEPSEDGYVPGGNDHSCMPHDADYDPQDWTINVSELLRIVQLYNSHNYHLCEISEPVTEDGFCLGTAE